MEQTKQRLWILSELFPPDETSTSYILGEIANAMVNKYRVGVICGPEVYDKRKRLDANSRFRLDPSIEVLRANGTGLDKNTTKGKALSFLLMSKRLFALAKANIRKEDKVLMVTNPAPLVLLMCRLKRKCGFDWNVLVHDVFPENTKPAGMKLPMYGLIKKLFDRAFSAADQLIVIGRDMSQVLTEKVKNVTKAKERLPKITIIENWADINGIKPRQMPEGRIILEYAGNIGRVQGLDKVIEQLPDDVEFHLYGTGSMEASLKKLNHPRVFFHGPYYRSQQNEVLSACHISVVTLQEGMYGLGVPSKTYNILASGRPIIYFGPKNSEIDLLIRENAVGYCGWPQKWDMIELAAMGKRARELAVRDYSEETILNKFIKAV